MRIGSRLVLIAVGAILKFAVTASVSGVNLPMVGVVLMVVGIAGVVLSLIMASTARRTEVVPQKARVDRVEPQRVDDPRIGPGRLAVDRSEDPSGRDRTSAVEYDATAAILALV